MQKRIVIGVIAFVLVVAALAVLGRNGAQRPNDPDSTVVGVLGENLKRVVLTGCIDEMKQRGLVNETNNQTQIESACQCAANAIHDKFGNITVIEFKKQMQQGDAQESANAIVLKCAYAAGLN